MDFINPNDERRARTGKNLLLRERKSREKFQNAARVFKCDRPKPDPDRTGSQTGGQTRMNNLPSMYANGAAGYLALDFKDAGN